uniref:Uncharacterized protein n=1 Tax=Meloidogyne enterolobii TaxID=390850 RepID=A0A6V7V1E2_MELEN|nr:unnamed protein product [Meloidogyne enterolobii]
MNLQGVNSGGSKVGKLENERANTEENILHLVLSSKIKILSCSKHGIGEYFWDIFFIYV